MFNLTKEVQRLQQLKHTKIYGQSYKRPVRDAKVQHVSDTPYDIKADAKRTGLNSIDIKAEQEHGFILRCFKNYSVDFGRRLSKRKGQYHRPGGGFAGHIERG